MAIILKKQYKLVDLKVSLDTSGPVAQVVVRLEATNGRTEVRAAWQMPPAALGLSSERSSAQNDRDAEPGFVFPANTGRLLQLEIDSLVRDHVTNLKGHALWLHLEKPYGLLGLLPWERMLRPFVHPLPIVRLPDFVVPAPRENPAALDVVLCGIRPSNDNEQRLDQMLFDFASVIIGAVPIRRTTVHIFTDRTTSDQLRPRLGAAHFGRSLILHEPRIEPNSGPSHIGRFANPDAAVENPWLAWIVRELESNSVDALHFLGTGHRSHERPSFVMNGSPGAGPDEEITWLVAPAQLDQFLTRVGAWAFACTSVAWNDSPMSLRLLTDTLAQLRPGSFLFHEFADGTDLEALGDAYRFLFAPAPSVPLSSPGIFFYCQPYQVAGTAVKFAAQALDHRRSQSGGPGPISLDEGWAIDRHGAEKGFDAELPGAEMAGEPTLGGGVADPVGELYAAAPNVPAWVASTQRYIEQWRWQILNWERSAQRGQSAGAHDKEIDGVRRALEVIENALDETVRETRVGASAPKSGELGDEVEGKKGRHDRDEPPAGAQENAV